MSGELPERCVLASIHGNGLALRAVLDSPAAGGLPVVNLGDLVGYGPDVVECAQVARNFHINLMGNSEYCMVRDDFEFWTAIFKKESVIRGRELLEEAGQLGFFEGMDWLAREGAAQYSHYLPLNEGAWFAELQGLAEGETKLRNGESPRIWLDGVRVAFVGWSMRPGVLVEKEGFRPFWGDEMDVAIEPGERYVVAVGSVGLPQDGDWRPCFAVLRDGSVALHRIEYDVEAQCRKIMARSLYPRPDSLCKMLKFGGRLAPRKPGRKERDRREDRSRKPRGPWTEG